MKFMVLSCLIIAAILFIIWTVIMSIFVIAPLKENVIPLIAFVLGSCGYPFLVALGMASLKLRGLSEKQKLPWSLKSIFSIAFLVIGAIGAALIAFTTGDTWGHVLCGTCVYLLAILYLPSKRQATTILFALVLLGYAIFAIVYYHTYP